MISILDKKVISLLKEFNCNDINCYRLCLKADVTVSHGFKLLKFLEEKKLIKVKESKNKREIIYELSDKGKRIKSLIYEIEELSL